MKLQAPVCVSELPPGSCKHNTCTANPALKLALAHRVLLACQVTTIGRAATQFPDIRAGRDRVHNTSRIKLLWLLLASQATAVREAAAVTQGADAACVVHGVPSTTASAQGAVLEHAPQKGCPSQSLTPPA